MVKGQDELVDTGSYDIEFYDTASSLVTSQIPGLNKNICIAVFRECDAVLQSSLNSYVYSISEDDLAIYLSDANLHSSSFSLGMFIRRHPVQVVLIAAGSTVREYSRKITAASNHMLA